MELVTYGTILKNRIKECGYTQEEFAEKSGIGLSTLRKQINGTIAYRYDDLIKYAELLDCSYDYLLGYSKSPNRESADIVDKTGLDDESSMRLMTMKERSKEIIAYEEKIKVLNQIIQDDDFLLDMAMYLGASKPIRDTNKQIMSLMLANQKDNSQNYMLDNTDKLWLYPLAQDIERIKMKLRPELLEAMREDIERVKSNAEAIRTQAVVKANE